MIDISKWRSNGRVSLRIVKRRLETPRGGEPCDRYQPPQAHGAVDIFPDIRGVILADLAQHSERSHDLIKFAAIELAFNFILCLLPVMIGVTQLGFTFGSQVDRALP